MYAVAILRYRRPLEAILPAVDAHRAYLKRLKDEGIVLASGPVDPRNGGVLLLRVPDDAVQATLDAVRDGDPFTQQGLAQYELMPWNLTQGQDGLDLGFPAP